MSLHKSLVSKSALARQRNVMTREERLEKLAREGRWKDGESVFGLPKVGTVRIKKRIKDKKQKDDATGAAEGSTAVAADAAAEAKTVTGKKDKKEKGKKDKKDRK